MKNIESSLNFGLIVEMNTQISKNMKRIASLEEDMRTLKEELTKRKEQ